MVFKRISMGKHLIQACNRFKDYTRRWKEASGFGGGGVHGYRALEGTFLGGCIFSGIRAAEGIHHHIQ